MDLLDAQPARELVPSLGNLDTPSVPADPSGSLSLPQRLRDTAGSHYGAIQQQVLSNRSAPDKLPRKLHAHPSEVSPFAPPEVVRKFPHYLRDAQHHQAHPTHSMLKRAQQQQQAAQQGLQQGTQQAQQGSPAHAVPTLGQPTGAGEQAPSGMAP